MADPIVTIRGAVFQWPGTNAFGIKVPELEITSGESVMLLGPSGTGKSTLLSLICGVLQAREGEVSVLGQNLTEMGSVRRDQFRAEHIGVIFQQFNLLPYGSILDNVALPLSFAPNRRARAEASGGSVRGDATRLLAALDLGHIAASRRASDLSIGQQQRVAVARALIGEPELIVADEPTSALDRTTQERFIDLLFAQVGLSGATLLMVSHDERLSARFDRVLALDDIIQSLIQEQAA